MTLQLPALHQHDALRLAATTSGAVHLLSQTAADEHMLHAVAAADSGPDG